MRHPVMFLVLALLLAACGTSGPTSSAPPSATLLPLPESMSGIPAPNNESTAEVSPVSPTDELEVGVAVDYNLGHCGLGTPIDIDGSLWDPIGTATALTQDQSGELINSTPVVIVLTAEDTMQLQTPNGAVLTLARHDGPRRYFLCD